MCGAGVDDSEVRHYGCVLDPGSPEDDWRALGGPESGGRFGWTPEQAALVSWLNTNAPSVEPFYRGAVVLAAFDSFPGRVHFITHAIREIGNRLPTALGPKVKKKEAGYEDHTRTIRRRWLVEGLPADGKPPQPLGGSVPSASGPRRHEVTVGLLRAVGKLIAAHDKAEANREARERAKFGDLSDLGSNPSYVIKYWGRWADEAVEFAHAREEPLPAEKDAEWVAKFYAFEQELMAIARPSYENLDALDGLLGEANTR